MADLQQWKIKLAWALTLLDAGGPGKETRRALRGFGGSRSAGCGGGRRRRCSRGAG